jgi:hypothetical protein
MRRAFYCTIQIYDDNESFVDPVLLSVKRIINYAGRYSRGRNLYLKISVVIVDGETINSGERNGKHAVKYKLIKKSVMEDVLERTYGLNKIQIQQ